MKLKDKIAIVTGASNGIGAEIAKQYADEGAKVIAVDLKPLSYDKKNVESIILNVTDSQQCEEMVKNVIETYGRVDILVNNAGITRDALTEKITDEMWNLVLDVNLKGVFNITKHVGKNMMKNGSGSIINIASVVGEYGNIGQANYSAAKAGLIGLSKTWAKEYARKGAQVRVNSISPGYVMTDILKTIPQDLLDKFAKQTMLGRLGQPEEIAKVTVFLASEDSSYITGHNLSVNGGMRL